MAEQRFPDDNTLTASQKIAATIIGALVVVFLVLLVVGSVRLVKRLQTSSSKSISKVVDQANSIIPTDTGAVTDQENQVVVRDQNGNYKTMPSTGPRENLIIGLFVLMFLGIGSIAISKKIF